MHSMIAGRVVILAAALIAACADPMSPTQQLVDDPTVFAAFARKPPSPPASAPDSAGIPPMPPPIFEEMPAAFDGSQ